MSHEPEEAFNTDNPWFASGAGKAWLKAMRNEIDDTADRITGNVVDIRNDDPR